MNFNLELSNPRNVARSGQPSLIHVRMTSHLRRDARFVFSKVIHSSDSWHRRDFSALAATDASGRSISFMLVFRRLRGPIKLQD